MAMPKLILSLSQTPPPKTQIIPSSSFDDLVISRRNLILTAAFTSSSSLATCLSSNAALIQQSSSNSPKSFLSGIANTNSWFQFYGDGFAIRVPPDFQDINEPDVCFFFPFFLRILLDFVYVLAFQNSVWIV